VVVVAVHAEFVAVADGVACFVAFDAFVVAGVALVVVVAATAAADLLVANFVALSHLLQIFTVVVVALIVALTASIIVGKMHVAVVPSIGVAMVIVVAVVGCSGEDGEGEGFVILHTGTHSSLLISITLKPRDDALGCGEGLVDVDAFIVLGCKVLLARSSMLIVGVLRDPDAAEW